MPFNLLKVILVYDKFQEKSFYFLNDAVFVPGLFCRFFFKLLSLFFLSMVVHGFIHGEPQTILKTKYHCKKETPAIFNCVLVLTSARTTRCTRGAALPRCEFLLAGLGVW